MDGDLSRLHRIQRQQDRADHNRGVGNVEVGPMVRVNVNFNEIDHGAVRDAIVHVAQRSRKHHSQPDCSDVDVAAKTDQGAEDREYGENRERNQGPSDGVRRSGVREE